MVLIKKTQRSGSIWNSWKI